MPLKHRIKLRFKRLVLVGLRFLLGLRQRLSGPVAAGDPASILVIETAFLGDVAAATPLIRELAQRLPRARLTALIRAPYRALLRDNPHLAGLELVDSFRPLALFTLARRLRARDFAAVICASPGVKNSLLSHLIGRRLIMGYLAFQSREPHYYQDHRVEVIGGRGQWPYGKDQHIITRARLAAAPLLGIPGPPAPPEIHLEPGRERTILSRLEQEGFLAAGGINLVVHPGATFPERRWPASHWTEVLTRLRREHGQRLNPVLIGVGGEEGLCQEIADRVEGGGRLFVGRDLFELCVLIKHAQAFLGGDSGPKFIADAFGLPMVVLHGPQRPETVGPVNPRGRSLYHQLDCNPCPQADCPHQGKCVRSIAPEEVVTAMRACLAPGP